MNKANSDNPDQIPQENRVEQNSLKQFIQSELAKKPGRTHPIEYMGKRYWVKQPEKLDFRMRIQKGNALRSFEAERKALKYLSGLELPVAPLVAEGPDWFAIEDGGIPLDSLLKNNNSDNQENIKAFTAAGQSLVQLHRSDICHGRPSLGDILWDGMKATFIDFELFSPKRNSQWFKVMDIIVLVICIFAIRHEAAGELEATAKAYRSNGGERYWQQAKKVCKHLLWFSFLLAPIGLRKTGRARDVRAIVPALRYIKTMPGSFESTSIK